YVVKSKCRHLVYLGRLRGGDDEEAWARCQARLQRRRGRGSMGPDLEIPDNARYGAASRPHHRKRPKKARKAMSEDVLKDMKTFSWPSHHQPSRSEKEGQPPDCYAACCGGAFDTDGVFCSSTSCCSTGWWHVDCALKWSKEKKYPAPNLDKPDDPWYCPQCRPRRRVPRKRTRAEVTQTPPRPSTSS
ncbi:hypothetical protein FOZ62_009524, partial [Perkinsus olseni]